MAETAGAANVHQITFWRNLLDAFAQLDSAWTTATEAQQRAAPGAGPGAVGIPPEIVAAFARAGESAARSLAGLAEVLAAQHGDTAFATVADAQHTAHHEWAQAHSGAAPQTSQRPAPR